MILPIYIYGQPVLRKVAEDITPDYPQLKELIADMWDTLAESEGIGLAAPQIGKAIRLSVIDLDVISDDLPEYKDFRKVFINPHIIEYDESNTDTSEEGCLSLPAIHEKVVRPTRIHVAWDDEQFQHHDEWIEGYLAWRVSCSMSSTISTARCLWIIFLHFVNNSLRVNSVP